MAYCGSPHKQLRENGSVQRSSFCHKLTYNCIGSSLDIVCMYWTGRGIYSIAKQRGINRPSTFYVSYTTISTLTQIPTMSGPTNILTNQKPISLHKICTLYEDKEAHGVKQTENTGTSVFIVSTTSK
jgi:hypothetical protein